MGIESTGLGFTRGTTTPRPALRRATGFRWITPVLALLVGVSTVQVSSGAAGGGSIASQHQTIPAPGDGHDGSSGQILLATLFAEAFEPGSDPGARVAAPGGRLVQGIVASIGATSAREHIFAVLRHWLCVYRL